MELEINANATRIPKLNDTTDDSPLNWTTNLTHFAAEVANYSLNFMDVGVTTSLPEPSTTITSTTTHLIEAAFAIMANGTHQPTEASANIEDDAIRLEHAPQFTRSALIKVYVLSIMAVLSMFGNILTMWNIYKTRLSRRSKRHSWSAIYTLIFHLSIADVLVTGFCTIGEAVWYYTVEWLAGEWTCKLVKLMQVFSLYLSTYVLVLIGVDRWIAVKYPMKSLNMAKRCHRLLGGTYILSFLLSLPQFFIFRVARGPFIEEFHQCVTHGFYTALWQEQIYGVLSVFFSFLLPLCILFGTYLSTFRTISSSEKMFQGSKATASYSSKPSSQTNRQRLIHKAKMKSLRISVVIIFAFLICWTPYNFLLIIFMFSNPDKEYAEDLQQAIFFFGMSNSLVNPLIYGAFHLCPMKGKDGKNSKNNNLNRGDSQRTSMMTAVTQLDGSGRQIRTYRQPSYYRTHSNTSSCKEQVGLLSTPSIIRKSASVRSPHPHHSTIIGNHTHSTSLIANGGNNSHSTIVFSFDNHRGGNVTTMKAPNNGAGALLGTAKCKNNVNAHNRMNVSENVTSV